MKPYEPIPHHFVQFGKKTRIPYQQCVLCGLLWLKNPFSEWAVKNGCNNTEHPNYENKRAATSPFK